MGLQVQRTAVLLLAAFTTASECAAEALCAAEMRQFKSAMISIQTDYPSRESSFREIELFAQSRLPIKMNSECIAEIERAYPEQTLRVPSAGGGGITFYADADSFEFGFHITSSGLISGIYAKGK